MADLQTIIKLTQEELKRQVPTEQAVLEAIDRLKPREADVLRRRYGLAQRQPETLQEIGASLGVTRERVRQIESAGISQFRGALNKKPLKDLVGLAVELVRAGGGVMATAALYAEYLPAAQHTEAGRRATAFLLDQSPELTLVAASKRHEPYYTISRAHQQAAEQLIPAITELLRQAGQPLPITEITQQVSQADAADGVSYLVTEALISSLLELGHPFVAAPTAEQPTPGPAPGAGSRWGLADWPEINPRNIRDKTRFVMKQTGTPLHFKEVTAKITAARFDRKTVTMQAVHNELINGDEFVLIGRGIYALKEWGYLPGTVAEVIRAILRRAGSPLDREQIVKEVLKQRHVSRNTILINLQEKSAFKRVDKHSYTLES